MAGRKQPEDSERAELEQRLEEAERQKGNEVDRSRLRRYLMSANRTLDDIAAHFTVTRGTALDLIDELRLGGANLQQFGDFYHVTKEPAQPDRSDQFHYASDAKGYYKFGIISDTHYGSKYAREDVADALYDLFAQEKVKRVFHAGNWIDGEIRFNKFDLIDAAHGMQNQLDYFVERYPQRKGIKTYYVAGDDHEGWYSQREGVNIGQMLEDTARRAGRTDLVYMGYCDSYVTLEHKLTGNTAKLMVAHPGGGSSYATSYAPQKAIEALQPGEKPAVAVFGHWHKLEYLHYRGVHCIQAGCTKDLDPFGRKKRLQYHVGGVVVELWQDEKGAISDCRTRFRQFWDRDYYNDQFAHSHQPTRTRAPHGKNA